MIETQLNLQRPTPPIEPYRRDDARSCRKAIRQFRIDVALGVANQTGVRGRCLILEENMSKKFVFTLITFGVFVIAGGVIFMSVQPTTVAQAQQAAVDLTVYNSNIGMVKEIRQFDLKRGVNQVAVTDVPSQIIPESVHFRSLDDPQAVVLEQNYEYDIVGSQKLLEKYVDQPIVVITQDGGKHEGVLLSGVNDIIIQTQDGGVDVLKSDQVRQFSFPALPDGLITRPTLKWLVDATSAGEQDVEIAYLTNGISWESNYVLVLAQDSNKLDLDGWITLDNRSGAAYKDARLKLVAGDVNRVQPPRGDMVIYKEMAAVPTAAPEVEQREFAEYHLYEIPRPVTIKDNQTKQIQFLSARDVPAQKIFVFDAWNGNLRPTDSGAMKGNISVKVRFDTGEKGVNAQLPAGVVRLYQPDVDGSPLFIGEDRIDHTPKGEDVTLTVGEAFDLVGERLQTDMKRLGDKAWRESYRITVRNHKKDQDVEIHVVEHLNRGVNWEITKASPEKYVQLNSSTIEWLVSVPAGAEATVAYTVEYSQ